MKAIRFEFQPYQRGNFTFVGRNGIGICYGIAITESSPDIFPPQLFVAPINSKGNVSTNCYFSIPYDVDLMRDLGSQLLQLASTIESSMNTLEVTENGR